MINWGLGIEHEVRLRFTNKLDILNINDDNVKDIYENFKYVPEYIFINSNFILNMYNKYVKLLLNEYHMNNNKDISENNHYIFLNNLVNKKKEYPFDNIIYFNINNIHNTNDYLDYYFKIYKIKYFKFLNINFYLYDENNYNFTYLSSYSILNHWSTISSMNLDNIKNHFDNLMDGTYEKKYITIIKKYLKLHKFNIIEINNNEVKLKFNKNNKNSPILNINILKKNIFNTKINPDIKEFILKFKNNNEILILLKKLYDNSIPHIDFSAKTDVIEFKTYDYKNKNYEVILDDLINIENTFFYVVNEIPELKYYIKKY